jgi:hypothetical protein
MDSNKLLKHTEDHFHFRFKKLGGVEHSPEEFTTPQSILNFEGLVLNPKERPCRDCGQLNANRTVSYQLKNQRKETYWLKKCEACGEKSEIKHPLRSEK